VKVGVVGEVALAGLVALVGSASAQPPRVQTLVSILRPVLPYPAADVTGDVPIGGGAESRWFVLWPAEGESRVVVRANPLHPDTQAAGTEAMERIQEAVIAAERRAQAAYERALEELRRTGKTADLEGISLDDEGVAGERIDAELELTIEVEAAGSFEIGSSIEPVVTTLVPGLFVVQVPPNTYRETTTGGAKQRFRPAEARVFFGVTNKPTVNRRDQDRFAVTVSSATDAFVVSLRGNATLLKDVLAQTDWTRLRQP
jgi:hypothetical protein